MKLLKYKEILGKSKEKVDELMAPVRAMRMKKQAEAAMYKLDEEILTLQGKVQDLCLAYPIDFDTLLDTLDEIALLERREEQYSKVVEELFDNESN